MINRVWAMPSKNTFTIPPIRKLLNKYVGDGKGWIDPFAGDNSPAEITNDLNPDKKTNFHLHALEFANLMISEGGRFYGCLFDPPYSLRQVKECYENIGCLDYMGIDASHFPYDIKRAIAQLIIPNGIVISFGWNSIGFGKGLGFDIVEILLVSHGGFHNDTIVTIERKKTSLTYVSAILPVI